MSKGKVSINIGRIIIGVPPSRVKERSRSRQILQDILQGKFGDLQQSYGGDLENPSLENTRDILVTEIGAMEADIASIDKEEDPGRSLTDVDGYGEVTLVQAKDILNARVANLKPILELVDKAIADEKSRREAFVKESK